MERLRAMALPLEALPGALALHSADFTTNQEAASDDPQGTEAALANFQSWGRLLGYRVRYANEDALGIFRTGGLLAILARVVRHRAPAGAEAAFQDWERKLQDPAYLHARLATRPGATFQRFQPLPASDAGDRSLARAAGWRSRGYRVILPGVLHAGSSRLPPAAAPTGPDRFAP
tara:strand:- start:1990 stop:2514 length:525 start_codon:yes stop_codon:yes gene_type:complete